MLLLLPPSEAKTPASRGAPVDLAGLTAGEALGGQRRRVLDALARASSRPDALGVLGVGSSLAGEVARNTRLHAEPAAPAPQVYTGVLFAAAGLGSLPSTAARRAELAVRIFSGLWGVLAPSDRIPAYRLSMATDLPGIGRLAPAWRGGLSDVLAQRARDEVVVDCRSAPYAAAWTPPRGAEWVPVRVVRETDGRRRVVSHNAKHTRGVLVRHLLGRPGRQPIDAGSVLAAAGELVDTVVGTEVGTGLGYRLVDAALAEPTAGRRVLELVIS